jgi:transcriptional regulator with XRE-family HTH domain
MIAAQHLKELRLNHNFTQEYLALNLGISQKSYSNLETGVKKITINLVNKIAICYQIRPMDLVGKLVETSPELIDSIKKEQPLKTQMEIHHGVNDSLQMELIKTLNHRIEDLQRIIALKDEEIKRMKT